MWPKGLLKEYPRTLSLILRCLDVLAVVISGIMAYFYKFHELSISPFYLNGLLTSAILTFVIFPFSHIYDSMRAQHFIDLIQRLIQSIFMLFISLAGLAFLTKTGNEFSREWFSYWMLFAFLLLILFRFSLQGLLRLMRSYGWNVRNVIVIGKGELSERLVKTMHESVWTGFFVVSILEHGESLERMPNDLNLYFNKKMIDEIWIALPLDSEEVKKILHSLRHHTVTIRYILDIFGLGLINHSVSNLVGFPAISLNSSPMVGMNRIVKAIEDRLLALFILILISPLLLIIGIAVKLTSKGPVLFKQCRHGCDGKVIKVYKFRTMIEHQENEGEVTQAKMNDPRITKLGKFLRKTSLDELPQFFNVLQGRMSIVGPRPHAIEHNEFYKDSINAYMQRHKVKPGITGWAQVNGWRGETETLDKMQKRIEYDLYYIEHWSLGFDLKIILLTLMRGLRDKNAY